MATLADDVVVQDVVQDKLDAHPFPLEDGVVSIAIHFYVFTDSQGRTRLGVYGILPTRRWRRIALLHHIGDAIRRHLEDEIESR